MNEQIKEIIQKNEKNVIKSIQEIVQIPSVRNLDDKTVDAPFGKDVKKALDYIINLGKSFGMRTFIEPNSYYGYIEIGPEEAEEMIGIVGHVDVVPQGDENLWLEGKPFSGDIVDEKIIGRGTLDDKGPMIICLYAMKNILDLKLNLNKRIRMIIGTAEETTWECIDKYVANEEHPTISFSPDADFPLINAEKTIIQFEGIQKSTFDFTIESTGAYNAVADNAKYSGSKIEELKEELVRLNFNFKEDNNSIIVLGKGAHAMEAHRGENAITRLCEALFNISVHSPAIDFIAKNIKQTTDASLIQGEIKDEISGNLTLNIGRISAKDGIETIGFDSRIPVLADDKAIIKKYADILKENGFEYKLVKIQNKLYVEEDSFLVSNLMSVYKEVTQEQDAKPLSSGGGTYARAFENCVAFGCVFKSKDMINKMHQADECLEIKFLNPASEIYTKALVELLK